MQERVAVSGLSGFVGQHLQQSLEQSDCKIIPIERDGSFRGRPKKIFDLAAYGNLDTQKDVPETYRANVYRLVKLLEKSFDIEYEKFIITSTSSVLLKDQTPYSLSKKAAEDIGSYYHHLGKPITIVRPYTVYGPGEHSIHLIPKLIESCATGKLMDFVGYPVHDFIYVEDFVRALRLISETESKEYVFNIGTGRSYSNEQIKNIVESITRKKANINRVPSMRTYDTTKWKADNRAIRKLGWKPLVSIEEGIRRMIKEYAELRT